MIIVVNDANILIDLVKLRMLPHFFALGFTFCTTDLVLFELHRHQQLELAPYIDQGKLNLLQITEDQFLDIIQITLEVPSLSEQDCSAFCQARELGAVLLTSDNKLRKFAQDHSMEVHGHLWVFDQMVAAKAITGQRASEKLDELIVSINPKLGLPKDECNRRKMLWQI